MARIRFGRGLVAAFMVAISGALGAADAVAAGGTWGATNAPYVNGVVCNEGLQTSPLVAWDFGDPSLDFLTTAVTSNGLRDSAQLPTAAAPGRDVTPVFPGELGFGSADDIATYAALLTRFGRSDSAAVAAAVFGRSDPGHVPTCADSGSADNLVARAQSLAGPYQISLTPGASPAVVGIPNSVTVTVRGSTGVGVPNVVVNLSSFEAVFAHHSSQTRVRTRADGTATVAFTATDSATSIDLTATAAVSVGLEAVTVFDSGFGQPYVGAVYADAPQTFTANTSVPIDTTANPHIAIAGSSATGVTSAPLELVANVAGMRGHSGQVQLAVTGPIALDSKFFCSKVSTGSVPNTSAYLSPAFDFHGDSAVDTGSWIPEKPGCYRIDAQVNTSDATPAASARAAPVILTVLDSTSTLATKHDVIGPGAFSTIVTIAHSYGLPGTTSVKVQGPLRPRSTDCSALTWSGAPTAASVRVPVRGDHAYPLKTSLTSPGCYLVSGSVGLNLPSGRVAKVPISVSMPSGLVFLLRPKVAATADQPWSVSPGVVPSHVSVSGTFGQPGKAVIVMMRAPAGELGCRNADYGHAVRVDVGAAVPFTGDGSFAVPSGKTPQDGCYTLVPMITMDANTAISASGIAGAAGSTVVAGVPLSAISGDISGRPLDRSPVSLTVWPALVGYILLAALTGGIVVMIAKGEEHEHRPLPGLDLLD